MDIYKKLANIHYNVDTNPKKVYKKAKKHGYSVESLSRGVMHVKNDKDGSHIVSVKGTNPLNADDLKSDLSILLGKTHSDKQFKSRKKEIKKIYKTIPKNETVNLTAHSLGGSIATSILAESKSIRNKTNKAELFNTGYTKSFHKELKSGLTKEDREELNSKIKHNIVRGDVVSEGIKSGAVGKVKFYDVPKDASLLERHSLESF